MSEGRRKRAAAIHRQLDELGIARERLPAGALYAMDSMRLARLGCKLSRRIGRRNQPRSFTE